MALHAQQFIEELGDTKRKIIRNTFWLSVAEIGSRIARGALAIVAARMLGVSGIGVFTYALALGGFLTFFEDAGIGMFVTREFAKGTDRKGQVFGTALALKLLLLGFAICIFLSVGPAVSSIPSARIIIPIIALILISDSLRTFFFSITRAEQQMHLETRNQLITNGLVVVSGIVFMTISPTPLALALGYAFGGWVGLVLIFLYVKKFIPNIKKTFSKKLFFGIFAAAWPFTVLAISNVLIFNTDTLFLGHYSTTIQVGLYGAASRLVQALYILPALFATSTFPTLVKKSGESGGLRPALKKAIAAMAALAVILTLIMTIGAKLIMTILFGHAFAAGSILLAILAISYIPIFIGSMLNNVVFALNRQRQFVIANVIGMIVNIFLDFVLVPRYQAVGAAVASVIGLTTITIVTIIQMKRLDNII